LRIFTEAEPLTTGRNVRAGYRTHIPSYDRFWPRVTDNDARFNVGYQMLSRLLSAQSEFFGF